MKAYMVKAVEIFQNAKQETQHILRNNAVKFFPIFLLYSVSLILLVRLFLLINIDFR